MTRDQSTLAPTTRLALAVIVIAGIGAVSVFAGLSEDRDAEKPAAERRWVSSAQCRDCHREVWDEWRGSQHQVAYLNPAVRALSEDFRNKACQACHLPRPVAQTGYLRRTLPRTTLPDEGIGCLSCHLGPDGSILGRNDNPTAPCEPRAQAEVASVALCESCHNQHGTTDQWRATPFFEQGVTCNDCHMPKRDGGGFHHEFHGGHSRETVLAAVALDVAVEAGTLRIDVTNRGAGHNFPTEERSRAADVQVSFDVDGASYGEDWERVHRFRLPYRSEPLPDTTLPYGETHTSEVAIPAEARRARVQFWYRRTPFAPDGDPESMLLFDTEVDLVDDRGARITSVPRREVAPAEGVVVPVQPLLGDPGAALAELAAAEWTGPELPALTLEPRADELASIAATAERPVGEDATELDELIRSAYSSDYAGSRIAQRARRALEEREDVLAAWERALLDSDRAVRAQAAWQVGQLGDQASMHALLLCMKDADTAGDFDVVVWAVRALCELGNDSGLPRLWFAFDVPNAAELAGQQAIAICRMRGVELGEEPSWDELREGLRGIHDSWRTKGFVGETAPILDELTRARIAKRLAGLEEFQLRGIDEARYIVSRLGVLSLPLVERALTAQESYTRAHTLEIVRDLGEPARQLGALALSLLADPFCQSYAAEALGEIGYAPAAEHLVARLDHPDLELRAKSAEALAGMPADPAVDASLRGVWGDDSQPDDVRVRAAYALACRTADPQWRTWLEEQRAGDAYHVPTLDELLDRIDARTR